MWDGPSCGTPYPIPMGSDAYWIQRVLDLRKYVNANTQEVAHSIASVYPFTCIQSVDTVLCVQFVDSVRILVYPCYQSCG